MSAYTISAIETSRRSNYAGDFYLSKKFQISHPAKAKSLVHGIVIQRVDRKTSATIGPVRHETNISAGDRATLDAASVFEGRKLKTSEEIASFTSNNVNYATHSYYEIFPILNGESNVDRFGSGAISAYYSDGKRSDNPSTTGNIHFRGRSFFIELEMEDVKLIKSNESTGGAIGYGSIVWSSSPETPANGLFYIESTPSTDAKIASIASSSGTLTHIVDVTWTGEDVSELTSTFTQSGGRHRCHAVRRTYRKRKQR
jgi:hypothetical protein